MIRFKCPECGKGCNAPDDSAGRIGKCPKCGQRIAIPNAPDPPAPPPASHSGADVLEGAVDEYDCPHCRNRVSVAAKFAGQVVACPYCGGHIAVPLDALALPSLSKPSVPTTTPSSLVTLNDDGHLSANFNSVPQAKQAIKELKLMKKQLNLRKRQVNENQRVIRSRYTGDIRQRGSKVRGLGKLGRIVRGIQTISRDNARAQLARDLEPLEREKQTIESVKHAVDSMILQIEEYIELNS